MGKRKIGERTCIGCGRKAHKSELLRFVVDEEGRIRFDPQQRAPGRAGYLCRRKDCAHKATKKRRISSRFRKDVQVDSHFLMQTVDEQLCEERTEMTGSAQDPTEEETDSKQPANVSVETSRSRINSPQVSFRRG
jgi:predicted RNA-binding protein YlxR (DUF448 family)